MQQEVKPTDTPVVGKKQNQIQQDMQGAPTVSQKQSDKQVVQKGQTQQGNQPNQTGTTQQGKQQNQTSKTQKIIKQAAQGNTQQGAIMKQHEIKQQGDQSNLTGQTQQGTKMKQQKIKQKGDQSNLTGQTQQGTKMKQQKIKQKGDQSNLTSEDQYDTLCQKMKQKRQNFRIATQQLNAAANQLLQKRKHDKKQYFQHTDAKCRNAIPKMMNAEASTRQGVGSVAAYGKAGVGAISRGVTSLFKKK